MPDQESLNASTRSSKRFWPLAILGLLMIGGGIWALNGGESQIEPAVNEQQAKSVEINLVTEVRGTEQTRETLSVPENATVLEAMEASDLDLEIKEYSFGKTIEKINGVGGEENTYWLYSVNAAPAMEGVSTQRVNAGDVITWSYGE